MLYVCVQRFDVTRNLEKFCKILKTKQALTCKSVQKFMEVLFQIEFIDSAPMVSFSLELMFWVGNDTCVRHLHASSSEI